MIEFDDRIEHPCNGKNGVMGNVEKNREIFCSKQTGLTICMYKTSSASNACIRLLNINRKRRKGKEL